MNVTTNPNRIDLDEAYMQMAEVWARRSKANRLQVGALIVKDRQIISDGYNGMPSGAKDDVCEELVYPDDYDGRDGIGGPPNKVLRTKREVLHAESNALMKISENGGVGAQGATLYTTYSPCFECSKLIRQAKIRRVVFRNVYRDISGVEFLREMGIQVDQLGPSQNGRVIVQQPQPIPVEVVQPIPAPPPIQAQRPSMLAQIAQKAPAPPSAHWTSTVTDYAAATANFTAAQATPPASQPSFPSDDEVMRALREAGLDPTGVPAAAPAPRAEQIPDGPYRSGFL